MRLYTHLSGIIPSEIPTLVCLLSSGTVIVMLTWWEGDDFQALYFPRVQQTAAGLPLKRCS